MYCTYCGIQNTDDANFCFNCGKAISPWPSEAIEQKTEESELQETQDESESKESEDKKSASTKQTIIILVVLIVFFSLIFRCLTN